MTPTTTNECQNIVMSARYTSKDNLQNGMGRQNIQLGPIILESSKTRIVHSLIQHLLHLL